MIVTGYQAKTLQGLSAWTGRKVFQQPVNGGSSWSTDQLSTTNSFTLPAGKYDLGAIQVRQFDALHVLQPGTASYGQVVIDQINPPAPNLANASQQYESINYAEATNIKNGVKIGATISSTFNDDLKTYRYFDDPSAQNSFQAGSTNAINRLLKYLPPCPRRQPLKRSSLIPCHYH